ncbi:MAG: type II toxin-antitoxin system VapB family antitoxin [Chitinophaga sp.]|uniref:type II toxin-antitoxin system VapB family antitoxin n=1 Tax=Chitinophaga sp. TaxID=1869181 RepID=UPI001AFEDF83|nr:type II toxin-antitoxin system VapB family antitoxin [Chitinophaga sp.]MBO9729255.1 type II toxin-antitoxin system VapB family antitoxin [Chitinophaga sp.]
MAKTTIDLDDKLIKEAMRLCKGMTKKEVVNTALQKLIMGISQQKFLQLRGKITFWDDHLDESSNSL